MTTMLEWVEHVGADTPGASVALLTDAVRDALIEFCERSRAYRYDIPAIDVVTLTPTYLLDVPLGTRVQEVIHAEYAGNEIFPRSKAQLDQLIRSWRSSSTLGVPGYYYLQPRTAGALGSADNLELRLVRTPADSLADGLVLEVALKFTPLATSTPDWMLDNHKACIQHGAKWKLFSMAKKPWSNPQLALYHMQQFHADCGDGAITADRDYTKAPLRCTPHR